MPLSKRLNFQEEGILSSYISGLVDEKIFHINYAGNVEQATEMGVHLKGDKPIDLLTTYRPNEPEEIRNYRLEIFEPITEGEGKRIVNVLSKIQQSSNFSIKFPEQTNVPEDETLEAYTTENYPHFGSLTDWAFNVALKQDLIDANSLVVVMPLVIPEDNVSFLKPFTFIYRSDQVLDYGLNYYTILLDEKNVVDDVALNVWLIVTDTQILKLKQLSPTDLGKVEVEILFQFDFGEAPAFFMKGDYRAETIPFAYNSFVSGILPFWNKAIRMDSDLDAQYVQHLYTERVEMEVGCDAGCHRDADEGIHMTVRLVNGEERKSVCNKCGGNGWSNGRSPYGVTSVRKDALEGVDSGGEFPGVTYIDKPTDIVDLTQNKIDKLISQGFQSISMDIIDKVGDNQSGIAKTIDRSELNSFFNKVSDNLFDNILFNSYKFISLWRFSVVGDPVMPTINKPTVFDTANIPMLVNEIEQLSKAGVDTTQLELDLIDKKFPNDTDKQKFNKNIINLDPLSGKTEDDKTDIKLNGGVTQEQYILSSNIRGFILDAVNKDIDFLDKPRDVKQAALLELARRQIIQPIEIGITEES